MTRGAGIALFGGGLAIGIAVAALLLHGLPQRPGSAQSHEAPKAAATSAAHPAAVTIEPSMMQNLGVRTAAIEPRVITAAIRTTGYVSYDENRVSKVNARIGGWIQKVRVAYAGQEVRTGQQLLEIYSPELMLTEEDYLRSRELATSKVGDGGARRDGAELMAAAAERLKLWGIATSELRRLKRTGHVSESVPIEATASGVVTATTVTEGAHVKAGDDLYTIADLSRVWVYADIYERELSLARVGQPAVVTSDALAGNRFNGRVAYIYPEVNQQTRTVKVRLEFDNPRSELRPGMYVKVTLLAPSETRVLAVPAEAVLNSGLRNMVIVDLGGGHFEPREVEVGAESSGYFAVLSGLHAGERVVTSAQFLIDSESNLNEALSAMSSHEPKAAASASPEKE